MYTPEDDMWESTLPSHCVFLELNHITRLARWIPLSVHQPWKSSLYGTSASLKPIVLGPHRVGFLADITLVFFQKSTDSCFDWVNHPAGTPQVLVHFLQVRVAFEKLLVASWDTPGPLCKLFLFRAATRGFVDFYSDVLGQGIGTSCKFLPTSSWKELLSWIEVGLWGRNISHPSSELLYCFFFLRQGLLEWLTLLPPPPTCWDRRLCATMCHLAWLNSAFFSELRMWKA